MIKLKRNIINKAGRIEIAVVCLLLLLNGCALLGTVIQLAPLAAIFVYYSTPSEVKKSEFACLKTVEYYKQGSTNQNAVKTGSEYYICLVSIDEGSVREIVKLPDNSDYNLDKAVVYFAENKIYLALDEAQGTWQAELDGSSFRKVFDEKVIPAEYIKSKANYALLPVPEIKEVNLP